MADIAFRGVSKVYPDGTTAVSDLTLDISDGELLVFVGPSGCGKTTALRLVAGLEEITGGEVSIGGTVVNEVSPKDRDIAMVFQSYALYPHMTVFDNMAFGLRLQKMSRDEITKRVEQAATTLGLTEHLDRKPRALSGGQRQRVAMGRAIVREPKAFLMDEPLSNLDAKLRVQMRAEISSLQRKLAVTTIYVTHDQVEAMTMGDRVAVMRKGELQQVAPPQELYDNPVNIFVAGFIGSPAMNIFLAKVEGEGDNVVLRLGEEGLPVPKSRIDLLDALRARTNQDVVVGIRPEDLEDPGFAAEGLPQLGGTVTLREPLGSEVVVHTEVDARPALTEDVRELAADRDEAALRDLERARKCVFVGRFDPETDVKEDQPVRFAVDTRRMHVFDPRTGLSIRQGGET